MAAEGSRSACASLIRKVLVYVVENPDAKDTLDGINEFWLADSRVRHSKDQVRAGLEFLVESKDWLTKGKAGASVTLYGLNKDRLSEIKSFLEETGEC